MQRNGLPSEYERADGPDGLKTTLEHLHSQALQDPSFAERDHFILYELGDQKSLIKIDMQQMPYHFTYDDLLGRPATNVVKDTIARFLWEKCGEKERYLKESREEGSQ